MSYWEHNDCDECSDAEDSYDVLVREEHLELVSIMLELCDTSGYAHPSEVAIALRERDPAFFSSDDKFKTLIIEAAENGAPIQWCIIDGGRKTSLQLTGFARHWAVLLDVLCDLKGEDERVDASLLAKQVRERDPEPDFWYPTTNRRFKDMVIEASENGTPVEWITDEWGRTYVELIPWW